MNKQLCIMPPINPVVIGKIGSAYGIRGWLRVASSTEEPKRIFDYQPWFIQKALKWQLIELERWKLCNHCLIIKIIDIEDREAAALLTNSKIIIDASQLPELDNGEYYWKDLLGCQVITVDGYQLGKIINLIKTGSNDVLVVKANLKDAFGTKERLIPFLDGQVIKNIDLTAHVIKIDWDLSFFDP